MAVNSKDLISVDVNPVVQALMCGDVYSAVRYISPKFRIKATRRLNGSLALGGEIVLSFGRPNFLERIFVKQCIKADVPFPVRKIQLRFWPKRRDV